MKLNHSQAARAVGVTRKTFYVHVDKKHISKEVDEKGNPHYDVSELMRVYPELNMETVNAILEKSADTTHEETPPKNSVVDTEIKALQQEIAGLREKASEADKFRELYEHEKERRERAERQEDESREMLKVLHRQLPAPAEAQTQAEQPRRKLFGIF